MKEFWVHCTATPTRQFDLCDVAACSDDHRYTPGLSSPSDLVHVLVQMGANPEAALSAVSEATRVGSASIELRSADDEDPTQGRDAPDTGAPTRVIWRCSWCNAGNVRALPT